MIGTLWFIVVGACAALVHALVFAQTATIIAPEMANALGFGVAFFVSFAGHRWLSFSDTKSQIGQSLSRFVLTSLAGFSTNELIFIFAIKVMGIPHWPALVGAMLVAALQTYCLSRWWAFHR